MWILLALNLVVAVAWLGGFVSSRHAQREPLPRLSAPASLRLLSELAQPPPLRGDVPPQAGNADAVAHEPQVQPSVPGAEVSPAVSASDDPKGQGAAAVAVVTKKAHSAIAPDDADSSLATSAGGAQASATRTGAPATPAAAADAVTLGDAAAPGDKGLHPGGVSVPASTPSQAAPEKLLCYRTAALSGDAYQAAGANLRMAGFDRLALQPQNRARPRYWVYWEGTVDQVGQVEARLRAAAVQDWYRLRMPGRQARLALGVFGQRGGALRRQRALAAAGVQAQIDERYAPQALLRWIVDATPAQVTAANPDLAAKGIRLEPCS
ncbi:MAG: hypothetical protein Kow0073_17970 [Immundisolibacter sp.]